MGYFTPEEEFDALYDLFFDEVDSWFNADIACCDSCHDEFLRQWPLAYYADNDRFQRNQINLRTFYSGSRINQLFSEDDFLRLAPQIPCPVCGNALGRNIYPYELPFEVPEGFEEAVKAIASLAQTTPFLILQNNFAKKTLSAIEKLAAKTVPTVYKERLFRARVLGAVPIDDSPTTYDFPPQNVVKEGRYNHAGIPVLYTGSSIETCWGELRNCSCRLLEFELKPAIKVLDLTEEYDSADDQSLLNVLVFSALMSAKQDSEGWYKPEYFFCRFIGDCAKAVGFDAIKYPSTRRGSNSYNLVILNNTLSISNPELVTIIAFHEK